MSIPLDIVFLKRDSSVPIQGSTTAVITSVRKGLRPWTLLPVMDGRATDTLELPTGEVDRLGLQPGRVLCIS